MTPKERVLKALRREVPDSVPRCFYDITIDNCNATTIEFFRQKTGKRYQRMFLVECSVQSNGRVLCFDMMGNPMECGSVPSKATLPVTDNPVYLVAADIAGLRLALERARVRVYGDLAEPRR